ncbi:hypothetical protein H920_01089 [Fukomys damarensis]|uniref:Uncharacterized protein n=1 Tax=Fukomys damarensis TaxID=885580 RepID=A0A091E4G7_FUKDA|nr:hypothetical protein H920_01089 [Fukomys damarensis]
MNSGVTTDGGLARFYITAGDVERRMRPSKTAVSASPAGAAHRAASLGETQSGLLLMSAVEEPKDKSPRYSTMSIACLESDSALWDLLS